MGSGSRSVFNEARATFRKMYNEDLVQLLAAKSYPSSNFKELILGLGLFMSIFLCNSMQVKPIGEYLADCVHSAVAGIGTNESKLIDVLTQISPIELQLLKEVRYFFFNFW